MTHIMINCFLSSSWFATNYWWIVLVVLIILVAIIIYIYKPKKIQTKLLDNEIINKTISLFGGLDNIKSVSKDGSRLNFTVNDLNKCQLEEIKGLGATGIFIKGNQIKLVLPFPTDQLLEMVNSERTEA